MPCKHSLDKPYKNYAIFASFAPLMHISPRTKAKRNNISAPKNVSSPYGKQRLHYSG